MLTALLQQLQLLTWDLTGHGASSALLEFFFYSDADHRDLHSFPTRRSSDLTTLFRSTFFLISWFSLLLLQLIRKKVDRKSGSAGMPRPISYAVFCLKKKKKKKSGMQCYPPCCKKFSY